MNDDAEPTWADEHGARKFMSALRMQREAQMVLLLGLAKHSTDPAVRACAARVEQLETTITDMEMERGKYS